VTRPRLLLAVLFAGALAWLAALVWAPFAVPSLAGRAIYAAAAAVCHQLPERTFHLIGGPLAVCARCLGLYAGGAAVAGAALVAFEALPASAAAGPSRARRLLAAAAVPTLITLSLEHLTSVPIGNSARFLTALPLGAAIAWVIAAAIAREARPLPSRLR
jgi:uncharacterized membrane protein